MPRNRMEGGPSLGGETPEMPELEPAEKGKLKSIIEAAKILGAEGLTTEEAAEIWKKAPTAELVEALGNPNIKTAELNHKLFLLKIEDCGLVVLNEGDSQSGPKIAINFGGGVRSREIRSVCACCMKEFRQKETEEKEFISVLEKAKKVLGVDKIFMQSGGHKLPAGITELSNEEHEKDGPYTVSVPVSKEAPISFVVEDKNKGEINYWSLPEQKIQTTQKIKKRENK